MVPGLLRAVSRHCQSESARADCGSEARPARWQLEIPLQQFAGDHPQLKRPELFLQRSRLPDRVRVRIVSPPALDHDPAHDLSGYAAELGIRSKRKGNKKAVAVATASGNRIASNSRL